MLEKKQAKGEIVAHRCSDGSVKPSPGIWCDCQTALDEDNFNIKELIALINEPAIIESLSDIVLPTEPTAKDVAERVAVAQALFNPVAANAARAAFLARQQPERAHAS